MTDTINDLAAKNKKQEPAEPVLDEQGAAEQLVAQAPRASTWSAQAGC